MILQEFDALIDKMMLAFEYTENLGQYVAATRILFQINEQLSDDLQLSFDEIEDSDAAKSFILQYRSEIKSAIVKYRQRLMIS
ncbi:MAG: hypothetical protein ACRBB2_01625 [Nitrosopumilus sp.]